MGPLNLITALFQMVNSVSEKITPKAANAMGIIAVSTLGISVLTITAGKTYRMINSNQNHK